MYQNNNQSSIPESLSLTRDSEFPTSHVGTNYSYEIGIQYITSNIIHKLYILKSFFMIYITILIILQ